MPKPAKLVNVASYAWTFVPIASPSATVRSVIPVIDPPEIDTLFAAWVAIVPSPKLVRAVAPDSDTKSLPSPTMKLPSVGVNAAMSESSGSVV